MGWESENNRSTVGRKLGPLPQGQDTAEVQRPGEAPAPDLGHPPGAMEKLNLYHFVSKISVKEM